jgi:hypothetical protein
MRFVTRATEEDLLPTKPCRDAAYDVATDYRGLFWRVQVKSTICKRDNSYVCTICCNHIPYRPDEIDFIAAYVIPTDTWYIIPIKATHGQTDLVLSPHLEKSKYAKYKEAWHLLKRK